MILRAQKLLFAFPFCLYEAYGGPIFLVGNMTTLNEFAYVKGFSTLSWHTVNSGNWIMKSQNKGMTKYTKAWFYLRWFLTHPVSLTTDRLLIVEVATRTNICFDYYDALYKHANPKSVNWKQICALPCLSTHISHNTEFCRCKGKGNYNESNFRKNIQSIATVILHPEKKTFKLATLHGSEIIT